MTASRKMWIMCLAVGLLALAPAAFAGPQRFTSINYPGATTTFALGINPAGDIVGAWDDSAGEHGFLLHAGKFTSFDFPGATWTDAYGITPDGDIIGQYGKPDKTTHGFMLRIGERRNQTCCEPGVTQLNPDESSTLHFYEVEIAGPTNLGLANSMPFGMSRNGTIAGCYHQSATNGATVGGTMHGFVLNADGNTFDPLAGTMHTGINDFDDVTGYSALNGLSYIIHSSDGSTEWFAAPNALVTRASGIGFSGDVVGWFKDNQAKFHAFLRHPNGETVLIDADFPGVVRTWAQGINREGDIVGYYLDATGYHAFLLSRRDEE